MLHSGESAVNEQKGLQPLGASHLEGRQTPCSQGLSWAGLLQELHMHPLVYLYNDPKRISKVSLLRGERIRGLEVSVRSRRSQGFKWQNQLWNQIKLTPRALAHSLSTAFPVTYSLQTSCSSLWDEWPALLHWEHYYSKLSQETHTVIWLLLIVDGLCLSLLLQNTQMEK